MHTEPAAPESSNLRPESHKPVTCPNCNAPVGTTIIGYEAQIIDPHFSCRHCHYKGTLVWWKATGTVPKKAGQPKKNVV